MSDVDGTAYADAYRSLRMRVTAMLGDADPAACEAAAPATPGWRARDVLAHMVGVNADILAGNLAGVASDAWTQAQVEARRDATVAAMLEEWNEISPAVEEIAPQFGAATGQWLFDACTHEHDLRHALGVPGAHDTDAVALGFEWATDRLGDSLDGAGVPGLLLHTETGAKDVGAGEPRTGVHASRFEIVRTMTGRRSRTQVEAYDWDGPPRPVHLVLAIFTLRADDFVE